MAFDYEYYLREDKMPHIWCPGCSLGIFLKSLLRAVHSLGWKKDDVVVVSGIGCTGRIPGYVDFNTLHTTHGRALTFATGIKMFNPRLHVIVVGGDGDMLAIGGNHFIHAARRNIDITAIVNNNFIYGMTGGQVSPTTPEGSKTTTTPYGNLEPNMDVVEIALGAGATFVARATSYHTGQLEDYIKKALEHKGFSVVDVLGTCPTAYGRRNKIPTPVESLEWEKKITIPLKAMEKLPPEKRKGKIPTGIFRDNKERREYTELYKEIIEREI